MLIIHVHVHVKPKSVADSRRPLIENVRSSRREGRGVAKISDFTPKMTVSRQEQG